MDANQRLAQSVTDPVLGDKKNKKDTLLENGSPKDIVIPVIGDTGVGKSTFICALLSPADRKNVVVGHTLDSCTQAMQPVIIKDHSRLNQASKKKLHGGRLIIVDTPGFNDTELSPAHQANMLGNWLEKLHQHNMSLAGVIYLFEISQARMRLEKSTEDLSLFEGLLATPDSIVLGLTKLAPQDIKAEKREAQLRNRHWRKLLERGAHMENFSEETSSAHWKAIDSIISKVSDRQPTSIGAEASKKVEELKNYKEKKRSKSLGRIILGLFGF